MWLPSHCMAQSLGSGAFTTAMQIMKNPGFHRDLSPITAEPRPSLRLWASARARPLADVHHNVYPQFCLSKPDISKWQAIGHFYLALTYFGAERLTLDGRQA